MKRYPYCKFYVEAPSSSTNVTIFNLEENYTKNDSVIFETYEHHIAFYKTAEPYPILGIIILNFEFAVNPRVQERRL